jgi:CheY-like chemotaxis protein
VTDLSDNSAHILVVDDDARVRQMLTRYFEQEGYRISAAADGAAMRARLTSNPVDVVLLDVVMPGEDGLSLARQIRAHSDIGIIMLTGRSEMLDRVVGLCQSNGRSSARGATRPPSSDIQAARARHSANVAERLCL